MILTITLGWWILPLVISVACFLFAYLIYRRETNGVNNVGNIIGGMVFFIYHSIALFVSLVSWLIYFVIF